jgi:hypothetical protein
MTSGARTLLFIHGMYMNALSWQPWVDRATAAGLRAEAVSWPFHEGTQRRCGPGSTPRWAG